MDITLSFVDKMALIIAFVVIGAIALQFRVDRRIK